MTKSGTSELSAIWVTALTSFVGPFLTSSVNVALTAIQKEFSADAVILSWVAASYILASNNSRLQLVIHFLCQFLSSLNCIAHGSRRYVKLSRQIHHFHFHNWPAKPFKRVRLPLFQTFR